MLIEFGFFTKRKIGKPHIEKTLFFSIHLIVLLNESVMNQDNFKISMWFDHEKNNSSNTGDGFGVHITLGQFSSCFLNISLSLNVMTFFTSRYTCCNM